MLPLLRTRNAWPNLADEFFNGDLFPRFIDLETRQNLPAVNIIEGPDNYKIEVAAPGLNKDDFKVNLENNVITISSTKEEKQENDDTKVMRKEFSYYSFSRSFTLPQTIDTDKISATHKDGVLHISIPKREESKVKPSREIRIS